MDLMTYRALDVNDTGYDAIAFDPAVRANNSGASVLLYGRSRFIHCCSCLLCSSGPGLWPLVRFGHLVAQVQKLAWGDLCVFSALGFGISGGGLSYILWQDALAGYRAIGLEEAAAILEESNALMGGDPSVNRLERQAQLEALEPDFSDLDRRFYAFQETVDFNVVMMAYIRRHREAFSFDGEVTKYVFPNQEQ
ncbi:MAG: DUF4375 domain-containing protein [Chloroflexi bacterium]|nr:MAG: DUF4375 domain-containing protein [Chloroflexota bacterium]MBL1193859.1 DUF4375 domain-containing protein [Chloroflexota bacterium]NOH11153.1 DUF4375 domain-containing protein [Chloroflexota bacterium]